MCIRDRLKEDLVCGILQYPGTLGDIKDPSEAISAGIATAIRPIAAVAVSSEVLTAIRIFIK